jgi:hypothetical protein
MAIQFSLVAEKNQEEALLFAYLPLFDLATGFLLKFFSELL